MQLRWLGVGGVELQLRKQVITIDPFFTRPPLWRLFFGRVKPDHGLIAETIQHCDWVLVSHAHYDHLMDVPGVLHNTRATAYGSANTCRLLAISGVPNENIRQVFPHQVIDLDGIHLNVLPAEHMRLPGFNPRPLPDNLKPPLRLRDYKMDQCFSFRIRFDGHTLLYWSSIRTTGAPAAEVLFIKPFEDRSHYVDLLEKVRPKVLIPIHWDDFFRPLHKPIRPSYKPPRWAFPPLKRLNLTEFKRLIAGINPEIIVIVPQILQRYNLLPLMEGDLAISG